MPTKFMFLPPDGFKFVEAAPTSVRVGTSLALNNFMHFYAVGSALTAAR
jgi:hypothetical protein